jgi:hypothetical protein
MPVRDIRSNFKPILAQTNVISTDTTTDGVSIDTADFDGGIMFLFDCTAYTDGTYTPVLEQSTTGAFAGEETAIADANLQGTEAGAAISAATVEAAVLPSIGIVGTDRYVRCTITSASTSTGATISVIAVMAPELTPDANLSA